MNVETNVQVEEVREEEEHISDKEEEDEGGKCEGNVEEADEEEEDSNGESSDGDGELDIDRLLGGIDDENDCKALSNRLVGLEVIIDESKSCFARKKASPVKVKQNDMGKLVKEFERVKLRLKEIESKKKKDEEVVKGQSSGKLGKEKPSEKPGKNKVIGSKKVDGKKNNTVKKWGDRCADDLDAMGLDSGGDFENEDGEYDFYEGFDVHKLVELNPEYEKKRRKEEEEKAKKKKRLVGGAAKQVVGGVKPTTRQSVGLK